MLQYILTGLAGIAIGVVVMRVWQMFGKSGAPVAAPNEVPAPQGEAAAASPVSSRKLLIGSGILAATAVAVLLLRQTDETTPSTSSLSSPAAGASSQNLDDVDTMIARLADRLEKNPDDGEGFRMLGWSYVMTGHPDKAIEPYKRAVALLPNNATVHAGFGEALAGVAGGKVTDEAKGHFERAVALDPKEPRSLYFLALWLAQNGREKEALEKWITLANSGPADAPWQSDLRARIAETSSRLGVDVSARLRNPAPAAAPSAAAPPIDPSAVQAAEGMPAGDRAQMIDGMVEGLANRLKTNPKDADGWIRLLRSRMVLKQADQARDDLAAARAGLAGDADGLRRVNGAAAEFGVPGAR